MIKVNEAVLVNRDYKYDSDKGEILISKKNFKKVHKDFKNDTPGKERMITYLEYGYKMAEINQYQIRQTN